MKINHDLLTGKITAQSRLIKTIQAIPYEDRDGNDYFMRKISDGIVEQVTCAGFYSLAQIDVAVFKKPNGELVEYCAKITENESHFEIYETPYQKKLLTERPEYHIDIVWGRGVWNGVNEVRNHLRLIGAEITNHPWDKMPYFTYLYGGEVVEYNGRGIIGQIPASLDTSKIPGIY